MNAKIVHAPWQLPFGYLYCSNQLVTCQSFSNLLSLLSDEHPKHKSSDHMNKKYIFFACRFHQPGNSFLLFNSFCWTH